MTKHAVLSAKGASTKLSLKVHHNVSRVLGTRKGNKPSTKLGIFNAALIQENESVLQIDSFVTISFESGQEEYEQEKASGKQPTWTPGTWTATEQHKWAHEFKTWIESSWSRQYSFMNSSGKEVAVRIRIHFVERHSHWMLHVVKKISGFFRSFVVADPDVTDPNYRRNTKFGSEDSRPEYWSKPVCLHEFGHMIGLGDVYVDKEAHRKAGDLVAHSALAYEYLGNPKQKDKQVIVAGDVDDIMSQHGNWKINAWDYVTFLEALVRITGDHSWRVVDTFVLNDPPVSSAQ